MFCGSCGAQNDDGAKFCCKCGKPLASAEPKATTAAPKVDAAKVTGAIKAIPKKFIGIAVVAVLVIAVICGISTKAGRTINLNKYLTIEATGYDGYGTAKAAIDWNAIQQKYGSKLAFTSQAKKEYANLLALTTPMEELRSYVRVNLDDNGNLTNAGKVKYTFEINEDVNKYLKVNLKAKEGEYTVTGLKPVDKFDPFESLTVTYTGIAPNGYVNFDYTGDVFNYYDFSTENSYNLKNGDVITVKLGVNSNNISYYAEAYGKVPSVTEKEYTVEGLDSYAMSYSDLTDDFITSVKKDAEDSILAYAAREYNSECSLTELSYEGYVMETVKPDAEYWGYNNYLYVIFTGTIVNSDDKFAPTKIYFPVQINNVLITTDGISYDYNNGVVGSSSIPNSWYYTRGYIRPFDFFMDYISSTVENYDIEASGVMENYTGYTEIENLADLDGSAKGALFEEAKSAVVYYMANNYGEDYQLGEIVDHGQYFLSAKSKGSSPRYNNKYYQVVAFTVSSANGRFNPQVVYVPYEFDGLVKLSNGDVVSSYAAGPQGYSSFPDSWYSVVGYIDGEEMYKKLVSANREVFTYEVSEELKIFGE